MGCGLVLCSLDQHAHNLPILIQSNRLRQVRHWAYMGSTAVVVVVHSDETPEAKAANGGKAKLSIISANVGDSRAVLSRRGKAVDLTEVRFFLLPLGLFVGNIAYLFVRAGVHHL